MDSLTEQIADCLKNKALYESVASSISSPVFAITYDHDVVWSNASAEAFSPLSAIQSKPRVQGQCNGICYGRQNSCNSGDYPCPLLHMKETGQGLKVSHKRTLANGDVRSYEMVSSPLMGGNGQPVGIIATLKDVTEMQDLTSPVAEKGSWQSAQPPFTGPVSREVAIERLQHAIRRAQRNEQQVAVVSLSMNLFKFNKETVGYFVDENILAKLTEKLAHVVRTEDTVARFGPDEFFIIFEQIKTPEDAYIAAKKLWSAVNEPMHVGEDLIRNSANLGISLFPRNGHDAETLLKKAKSAMLASKKEGGGRPQFSHDPEDGEDIGKLSIEQSLRESLEVANESDFFLLYQPIVDLNENKITKVEALLRWNHPELGIIDPSDFLYIAEESGLIQSLDNWVLLTACNQYVSWHDMGFKLPKITINLSTQGILRGDFPTTLARILAITGCPVTGIELEFSEIGVMADSSKVQNVLKKLGDMDVDITIDNFGTGPTSLSMLRIWPINQLKLDRSIISSLPGNSNDAALVRATLALAKNFQLDVVAEGIETEEQRAFLMQEGCVQGQGYLFSHPISKEHIAEQLIH